MEKDVMELKYLFYFLIGGLITSGVTYLANQSRGLVAAFLGTLPIITISTFVLIYLNSGQNAVLSYAKGLMIMIFPWMVFILSVIFVTPRLSFLSSLLIGLSLQMVTAFLIFIVSGRISPGQ